MKTTGLVAWYHDRDMDHLAYPSEPALPPLVIPFLCAQTFTHGGPDFFEYPKKRDWAAESHALGLLDCLDDELAKRAQKWLYFGTLC